MKIILWKLGSLDHKLLPTQNAVNKLSEALSSLDHNNEINHLIWGPDIAVKEININNDDLHVIMDADENTILAIVRKYLNDPK